jgi:diguanylate cyclase (GGDEF)-like protein
MANLWDDPDLAPERRAALLEAALAALPTGVEAFAQDGARLFANPAARSRETCGPAGAERESVTRGGRALLVERRSFGLEGAQYRLCAATDIDDERRAQDELLHRAYFDDLTKLPNRGFFEEAVGQSIRDNASGAFVVAVVGFDQFNAVNAFYGRAVGDALLVEAAGRIGGALGEGDMAARTDGDEFSLLIAAPGDVGAVGAKLDRVLARLKDPFFVNGVEILISASAGFSVFPLHDSALQGLIAKAGEALGQAKRRYKGEVRVYEPDLAVQAQERARLEQGLRLAVRDRRFVCAFQPKVDFRTGAVDGLEVLMRWRDDNDVLRAPGDSIAFALNAGLMNDITMLLFDEVVVSLDAVDATFGDGLRLGFNIAAQQAGDARFMRGFVDRLGASGHAHRFMIELTEEAFLLAGQFQLQVAPMLHEVGARISIDDFGVGYSSLSTLAEITADEIKVDRSLVTAVHQRPRSQSLLRAIESIGEALNTKVVVEGVEVADELAYLRDHTRLRVAQGYFFSRPIVLEPGAPKAQRFESWREKPRAQPPARTIERRSL